MSEERYFSDIKEIKVTTAEAEANELLKNGYELLKIVDGRVEKRDNSGSVEVVPAIMFVLGRSVHENPAEKTDAQSPEKTVQQESAPEPDNKLTEGILWNIKSDSYAWAYVKDMQGNTAPEKQALLEKINRAEGEYHSGGYVYSVSPDGRFLRRIKEK